jgi:hypothetical protein
LEADSVTADIVAASADNLIRFCPGESTLQRNLKIMWGLKEYRHRRIEKVHILNFIYTAARYLRAQSSESMQKTAYDLFDQYDMLFNHIQHREYSIKHDNRTLEERNCNELEKQFSDMIELYNLLFK